MNHLKHTHRLLGLTMLIVSLLYIPPAVIGQVLPSDQEIAPPAPPSQDPARSDDGEDREPVAGPTRGGTSSAAPAAPVAAPPAAPAAPATPAAPPVPGVSLPGFKVPQNLHGANYCGQYAMTSVLNALGANVTFPELYRDSNPFGIFSAPTTIVETLHRYGVNSSLKNGATIEDLRRALDAGRPAIVLVNSNNTPHWVAISGYQKDAQGNITGWELRDSVWGVSAPNGVHIMSNEEFTRIWSTPLGSGLLGILVGSISDYSNLLVDIQSTTVGPARTTPIWSGNFQTATDDAFAGAINDLVTGAGNLSPTEVLSGGVKLTAGGIGAVVAAPGRTIRNGGSKLLDDGADRFNRGGFINRTLGAGEWLTGGTLWIAGTGANAAGNAVSTVGNVAGNGLKKAGDGLSWVYNQLKFW